MTISADGQLMILRLRSDSFSFAKFLMYRDLESTNWDNDALPEHSVLQSALATGFQEPSSTIPVDSPIDEHLNPGETHHVVDADSSQALAIHDVSEGRNLVIQGPPGTGKSQTNYEPNCGSHLQRKTGAVCRGKDGGV